MKSSREMINRQKDVGHRKKQGHSTDVHSASKAKRKKLKKHHRVEAQVKRELLESWVKYFNYSFAISLDDVKYLRDHVLFMLCLIFNLEKINKELARSKLKILKQAPRCQTLPSMPSLEFEFPNEGEQQDTKPDTDIFSRYKNLPAILHCQTSKPDEFASKSNSVETKSEEALENKDVGTKMNWQSFKMKTFNNTALVRKNTSATKYQKSFSIKNTLDKIHSKIKVVSTGIKCRQLKMDELDNTTFRNRRASTAMHQPFFEIPCRIENVSAFTQSKTEKFDNTTFENESVSSSKHPQPLIIKEELDNDPQKVIPPEIQCRSPRTVELDNIIFGDERATVAMYQPLLSMDDTVDRIPCQIEAVSKLTHRQLSRTETFHETEFENRNVSASRHHHSFLIKREMDNVLYETEVVPSMIKWQPSKPVELNNNVFKNESVPASKPQQIISMKEELNRFYRRIKNISNVLAQYQSLKPKEFEDKSVSVAQQQQSFSMKKEFDHVPHETKVVTSTIQWQPSETEKMDTRIENHEALNATLEHPLSTEIKRDENPREIKSFSLMSPSHLSETEELNSTTFEDKSIPTAMCEKHQQQLSIEEELDYILFGTRSVSPTLQWQPSKPEELYNPTFEKNTVQLNKISNKIEELSACKSEKLDSSEFDNRIVLASEYQQPFPIKKELDNDPHEIEVVPSMIQWQPPKIEQFDNIKYEINEAPALILEQPLFIDKKWEIRDVPVLTPCQPSTPEKWDNPIFGNESTSFTIHQQPFSNEQEWYNVPHGIENISALTQCRPLKNIKSYEAALGNRNVPAAIYQHQPIIENKLNTTVQKDKVHPIMMLKLSPQNNSFINGISQVQSVTAASHQNQLSEKYDKAVIEPEHVLTKVQWRIIKTKNFAGLENEFGLASMEWQPLKIMPLDNTASGNKKDPVGRYQEQLLMETLSKIEDKIINSPYEHGCIPSATSCPPSKKQKVSNDCVRENEIIPTSIHQQPFSNEQEWDNVPHGIENISALTQCRPLKKIKSYEAALGNRNVPAAIYQHQPIIENKLNTTVQKDKVHPIMMLKLSPQNNSFINGISQVQSVTAASHQNQLSEKYDKAVIETEHVLTKVQWRIIKTKNFAGLENEFGLASMEWQPLKIMPLDNTASGHKKNPVGRYQEQLLMETLSKIEDKIINSPYEHGCIPSATSCPPSKKQKVSNDCVRENEIIPTSIHQRQLFIRKKLHVTKTIRQALKMKKIDQLKSRRKHMEVVKPRLQSSASKRRVPVYISRKNCPNQTVANTGSHVMTVQLAKSFAETERIIQREIEAISQARLAKLIAINLKKEIKAALRDQTIDNVDAIRDHLKRLSVPPKLAHYLLGMMKTEIQKVNQAARELARYARCIAQKYGSNLQ